MNSTSAETALKTLAALEHLSDSVTNLLQSRECSPAAESQGDLERRNYTTPELVSHAHSCGFMSLESADDHLVAYLRAYQSPATTLAPWTCLRGLLEVVAVAVWLLDPSIDAETRVKRHFAFRYEGFDQQRKMLQEVGNSLTSLEARIDTVERQALALGFAPMVDGKGRRYGIGQQWPGITMLIGQVLGSKRKENYRLLSAIAHGHHWAIHQVGYQIDRTSGAPVGTKHVHPDAVAWSAIVAAGAMADGLGSLWKLYGWDWNELVNLLEETYDMGGYGNQARTWR
jgi:hypothetical protein